jgi:CRP-like cAMP-binding protein
VVRAGTTLIREGDEADAFYVLLDGEMAVRARGEGAAELVLPRMGEGAYFGEIGLLERIPRTATVTAARDSRVLRISGDDFLGTLADAPASTALLEGARSRLARTHPTRQAAPAAPAPAAPAPVLQPSQADSSSLADHDSEGAPAEKLPGGQGPTV